MEVNVINQLSEEIYSQNAKKGFWYEKRNIGELLMLVTSELAEALEADRKSKKADKSKIEELIKEGHTWQDSEVSFKSAFENSIKDTFEDEIADAAIRIFDLAGGLGIDLNFHIQQKLAYNKTRPAKHGKNY